MSTSNITTAASAALNTAAAADAATLAVANAAAAATSNATTAAETTTTVGNAPIIPAGAVSTLMANITNYQYNPVAIQTAIMKTLSDVTNGNISIVDPSNPFVFCLEAASVLTAAFMIKNEANTRKQYPYAAQTPEDLYLHMSDIDYVNRFAVPATTTFSILLPLNEVLNKMVLDPITGIKKIVIPRNSFFTIAGIVFSIQYPIEIRQMQHGGIQVIYDTNVKSPLQSLPSNIIQYEIRQNINGEYIFFEFETTQFSIINQTATLNSTTDFTIAINFNDQYYYTRVYVENPNGTWTEIRTTHTDEICDINVPTAVLQVINNTTNTVGTTNVTLGGTVNVSIPQIYTGTGILNSGIRIDVYETKGPINMILWEYPFTAFTATWLAIDPNDSTVFTAPLSTFNSVIPFSTSTVSDGGNATSFSDLRNQVITNAIGQQSLPITNAQVNTILNIAGYNIVKNVDNITNRIFLATKNMPTPTAISLITPAAASMLTLNITIDQITTINSVIDNSSVANGSSVTITPDTIYQNINGVTTPVTNSNLAILLGLQNQLLAYTVTNGNYLYTPFHYVLDMTNNEFNVRPYYLDNPTIVTQLFVATNDTTNILVNTGTYSIYRSATGYVLTVVTSSTTSYRSIPDANVGAQLSFIPEGQTTPAYLLGTLMNPGDGSSNERIFSFDLSTNFNVNSNNYLQLTKFLLFANQPTLSGAALLTDFDIIYTTNYSVGGQYIPSVIDNLLGTFILPNGSIGITHEILRVNFGYSLDRLWSRARSVISTTKYKTWATDIPRTYEEDIYKIDTNGSAIQFDSNGNPVMNLLHSKGDPVLDRDNNVVYLHKVGDVVLGVNGNVIQDNPRGMLRQFDIMLIDGIYWFANDNTAVNYRTTITQSVLNWLINDLVSIETQLLEQTNIYFYPNSTLGTIQAMVDNGITVNIDASQSLNVNLYVSQVVYDDNALRSKLSTATISTISNQLSNTTFSIDTITTALRSVYGNDVISMQVSGIGGTNNYSVVTVINNGENCSIKKKLVSMPDRSLIVQEDVTITFILYLVSD